jgi:hypothetical protein
MIKLDEFQQFLAGRGLSPEKVEKYIGSVEEAITYFNSRGIDLEKAQVADFREYVSNLIKIGKNSYDDLMPLGRYVYMLDMKDAWIYYASILGGNTVYPSIKERLSELTSVEVCNSVFDNIDIPELGSDQENYPRATKQLMEHLSRELAS